MKINLKTEVIYLDNSFPQDVGAAIINLALVVGFLFSLGNQQIAGGRLLSSETGIPKYLEKSLE